MFQAKLKKESQMEINLSSLPIRKLETSFWFYGNMTVRYYIIQTCYIVGRVKTSDDFTFHLDKRMLFVNLT